MKKAKGKRRAAVIAAVSVLILCAVLAVLFYKQMIKINTPSVGDYPVRGVDVSSFQGDIDWSVLSEGLDFAYIKATEGSAHIDGCFDYNYSEAQRYGLRVGAYHFFSFDSGGDTQAENFIRQVSAYDKMLPPVVDVEFYGDYRSSPKPAELVVPELKTLINALEAEYRVKPVIYATGSAYSKYIEENFSDCDIWIRDVYFTPEDGWTFWQYSGTGRLDGYNGEEKYIDLNVFYGSKEEFDNYSLCKIDSDEEE